MSFMGLISLLPMLGFFALLMLAAIFAHRGQPFWGTWLMIGGSIALLLSCLASVVAPVIVFRTAASNPGGPSSNEHLQDFQTVMMIVGLLVTVSLLTYAVGLLGVAIRWGKIATRAEELEQRARTLAESSPVPTPMITPPSPR